MTLLEHVRRFNACGWATFPIDTKTGTGKEPVKGIKWKQREPSPFGLDEKEFTTGAYGIKIPNDILIVDLDPRSFNKGDNPWKRFKADHDLPLEDKETFIVKTGGGGYHIYLKKPVDFIPRKGLKKYPGVEFRGSYGDKAFYVVGPGSNHQSGKLYLVYVGDLTTIGIASSKFLKTIERVKKTEETPDKILEFSDDAQNIARYTEYLTKTAPVAEEGKLGDSTTFTVACKGRDFGLSSGKTLELMHDIYNLKCRPPWDMDGLREKVLNAYRYAERVPGNASPEMAFNEAIPGKEGIGSVYGKDSNTFDATATGKIKPTLNNLIKYLKIWKEVSDCVRLNEFSHSIEVCGKLPWHDQRIPSKLWSDMDSTHLKYYFGTKLNLEAPVMTINEAILVVASRIPYHPIKQYLSHLRWDGLARLDTWLTRYCGSKNTDYTRKIGRKTLLAAVTRVYKPGAKFDHVLVLEGKQGIGKSYVCAILGGEWFGDIFIDPKSKDTIDAMRGKWIIELSEMDTTRRKKDTEALKAFITRTEDRVRLAYARNTIDFPRQCIFIGTVNPDGVGYLNDDTGNRRFWPVMCKDIQIKEFMEVRDQLFAEAVQAYKQDEPLFIDDEEFNKTAISEAAERKEADPWIDIINEWSDGPGKDAETVSTTQIYETVLSGQAKNIQRGDQMRIGRALVFVGWKKRRTSKGCEYVRELYPDVAKVEQEADATL